MAEPAEQASGLRLRIETPVHTRMRPNRHARPSIDRRATGRGSTRRAIVAHFRATRRQQGWDDARLVIRDGRWPFVRLAFTPLGLARDALCPQWQTVLTDGDVWWRGTGPELDALYDAFSNDHRLMYALQDLGRPDCSGRFRPFPEIGDWLTAQWRQRA